MMPYSKSTLDPINVTNLVSPPILAELRESYQAGRLRFMVGAGSSIASGLPNWSTLNRRLISSFFEGSVLAECLGSIREIDSSGKELMALLTHKVYEDEELKAITQAFEEEFGRDAMIDLLRDQIHKIAHLCNPEVAKGNLFDSYLYDALYKETTLQEKLQPIHYELACSVVKGEELRALYTVNYDSILEDAFRAVLHASGKGLEAESVKSITEGPLRDLSIVHLHGLLPRHTRSSEGNIILSERDYLSDNGGWADGKLNDLIRFSKTDLLLVGMSLSDPRIRRLLHKRLEAKRAGNSNVGNVYAILSRDQIPNSSNLANKRAKEIVKTYSELYWNSWDISVIFIDNYELVPCLLRQIRLGLDPIEWLEKGRDFLRKNNSYTNLFSESKQVSSQVYLMRQHAFVRDKFEIALDEQININIFVPCEDDPGNIQLAFQFAGDFRKLKQNARWVPLETNQMELSWRLELAPYYQQINDKLYFQTIDEEHANLRKLNVSSWKKVQGASGFSLLSGAVLNASNESKWFYHNFEQQQLDDWDKERVYSSLLTVPVYDSAEWVPIAVASITSTKKQPFWQRLDEDESANLLRSLRSTVRSLLEYSSTF